MRVRSKHVRSSQRPLNNQEKEPDTFQVFAQRANKEGKRGGKERAATKKKRKEKKRKEKNNEKEEGRATINIEFIKSRKPLTKSTFQGRDCSGYCTISGSVTGASPAFSLFISFETRRIDI